MEVNYFITQDITDTSKFLGNAETKNTKQCLKAGE